MVRTISSREVAMTTKCDRDGDRVVLMMIGGGIITIILAVILTLAFGEDMPDWSESVMSAIVGGTLVKLADVLSALVQLSGGREREKLTDQLSQSIPPGTPQPVEVVNQADNPVPVEGNQ
ncbi:MAG TPA: hypothetical protein VMQ93_08755 [Novosphingobium sp.]|nr:hypothetical protein [Novosphingobium sp.]